MKEARKGTQMWIKKKKFKEQGHHLWFKEKQKDWKWAYSHWKGRAGLRRQSGCKKRKGTECVFKE